MFVTGLDCLCYCLHQKFVDVDLSPAGQGAAWPGSAVGWTGLL